MATLLYLPLEIFCYASPVLSVWYGFTGFRIEKIELTDQGLTEATA